MEYDRYAHHHKLYIVGMISLLLTLTLFTFSMYIVPYLIWDLDYHVPALVLELQYFFNQRLGFSLNESNFFVWLCFFLPSLLTGFISYFISNYIDNEIPAVQEEMNEEDEILKEEEHRVQLHVTAEVGLKIVFYMVLALAALFLLELIVTS